MAVLVPPPLRVEVDGLRRACGDAALGRVPAHVTLVPPVNVREEQVDAALGLLRSAGAAVPPFDLTLGPAATFAPDTPVLYLRVGGDVDALYRLRDLVFVPPLARQLTWPFVPHITLAQDLPDERLVAAVVALADFEATLAVERVHLLEERRDDAGTRVWLPVADAPLAPAAIVGRGGLPLELTSSERLDPEAVDFASREWEAFDVAQFGEAWGPAQPYAIVARREGRVVGIATGSTHGPTAHLANLLVAETERGTGVGSHLLSRAESLAVERGATSIALETAVGSDAEGFYRRRGWVEDARLPKYRMDRDFVRLRIFLGPGV